MRTKKGPNRAKTEEFRAQDFFRDGMKSMTSLSAQHPPVLGITKHRDSEAQKSEKMWRNFFWGTGWREGVTQA